MSVVGGTLVKVLCGDPCGGYLASYNFISIFLGWYAFDAVIWIYSSSGPSSSAPLWILAIISTNTQLCCLYEIDVEHRSLDYSQRLQFILYGLRHHQLGCWRCYQEQPLLHCCLEQLFNLLYIDHVCRHQEGYAGSLLSEFWIYNTEKKSFFDTLNDHYKKEQSYIESTACDDKDTWIAVWFSPSSTTSSITLMTWVWAFLIFRTYDLRGVLRFCRMRLVSSFLWLLLPAMSSRSSLELYVQQWSL